MTRLVVALGLVAAACGGADKTASEPTAEPTAKPAEPHGQVLTIAPFTLTITGTKMDGTKDVRVIRGSADGVITSDADGEGREVVRVAADGGFTPLVEGRTDAARLSADGVLTVNGRSLPGRVSEDGTLYRDDQPLLKIENGQVIGLVDGIMSSRVTANGQVVSETRFEMTVEGGDQVRRLVGAILLLQLAGGEPQDPEPATEITPSAEPVTP